MIDFIIRSALRWLLVRKLGAAVADQLMVAFDIWQAQKESEKGTAEVMRSNDLTEMKIVLRPMTKKEEQLWMERYDGTGG